MVAGAVGSHKVQPVAAWPTCGLGCDDLDDLATLELVVERNHAIVDFCANARIANLLVDAKCEIDRRRADWKINDLAFWRKHIHLLVQFVGLERIDELLGVV